VNLGKLLSFKHRQAQLSSRVAEFAFPEAQSTFDWASLNATSYV